MFRAAVENEAGDEDEGHALAEPAEGAPPVEQHAQLPPQEEADEGEHEDGRDREAEVGDALTKKFRVVHGLLVNLFVGWRVSWLVSW